MATASDDFNRSDGAIGANWTQASGVWTVSSNAANQTNAAGQYENAIYTATTPASNDYSVTAQVRNDGGSFGVGVMARGSTSAVTGYALVGFGGDQFYLIRLNAGAETVLTSGGFAAMAANTTYTVELEVNGTTIRGRINGGSWTSVTDSNISSGGWGLACYGSVTGGGRWMDSFSAADLAPATIEGIGSGTIGALSGSGTGTVPVIESTAQLWRAPFSAPVYVSGSSDLFDADSGEAGEIARSEIFDEADAAPTDITGTASGTIGALSGSGAGAVYITGAGSGTVGALTGSGAGGVQVAGSASGTIGALSGAGVGGPVVSGAASGTIGALSGQGSGAVVVSGSATGTIGALSGSGAGTVVGGISGVGSGTIGALSGSGQGSLTITGAATGSVGALTGAGAGALLVTGQAPAAIIGAITGTGQGAVIVAGQASGTIGALSGIGSGSLTIAGQGIGSVGALTGAGSGVLVINGQAVGVIGELIGTASGLVLSFAGAGERRVDRLYTDAARRTATPSRGAAYADTQRPDIPARPTARASRRKDMVDA